MGKVSVKNGDLLAFGQAGLLNIDYSQAAPEHGYKVFKTLRALKDAIKDVEEQRSELIRKHVPDDLLGKMQEYERAKDKSADGLMTAAEYAAGAKKLKGAFKDVSQLLDDSTDLEARPVPFDIYFAMKKDNKDILRPGLDFLLEGVLWEDSSDKADGAAAGE